jgi:hypothetical protein
MRPTPARVRRGASAKVDVGRRGDVRMHVGSALPPAQK